MPDTIDATTPPTMLAARLSEPGSINNLHVVELPVPAPPEGWVRLKVMAFGLNRSEYHSVHGMAEGVTFPRILGIEASGVIDLDPEGILAPGTQAVTMMGGMGRVFDGGYAQYVIVPRTQIITFRSSLPWEVIGSVPETLQTAYGALTTGLDLQPGQSLLVRGGTSALGLTTAALATDMGCRVYATSRREAGLELLCSRGAIPLLDDRKVAPRLREAEPSGVHAVLELVGVPTLQDSLAATAVHGTVCFSGMLSDSWTISDFYPMDWIPNGVRLTAYSGQAQDLPAEVLQRILDRIESGDLDLLPVNSYPLADIAQAHEDMALGRHVASSSVCPGTESTRSGRQGHGVIDSEVTLDQGLDALCVGACRRSYSATLHILQPPGVGGVDGNGNTVKSISDHEGLLGKSLVFQRVLCRPLSTPTTVGDHMII